MAPLYRLPGMASTANMAFLSPSTMLAYHGMMRMIISRKGFDSGSGGVPSPILPDGSLLSLPIPGGSQHRYHQLAGPDGRDMGEVVKSLTGGKMTGRESAHMDPDLWEHTLPRLEGWKPALGQVSAAQSHLDAQGVVEGDVFVFFGCFRPTAWKNDTLVYVPGSKAIHCLMGYLQIGEKITLGEMPDPDLSIQRPWLAQHPHMRGRRRANNTLHIASDRLVLGGVDTGLPGAAGFNTFKPELVLTEPGMSKSVWSVPGWMAPAAGSRLSYHGDPGRWEAIDDASARLRSVAKGQEFVMDVGERGEALAWIEQVARTGLGLELQTVHRAARAKRMRP